MVKAIYTTAVEVTGREAFVGGDEMTYKYVDIPDEATFQKIKNEVIEEFIMLPDFISTACPFTHVDYFISFDYIPFVHIKHFSSPLLYYLTILYINFMYK